MTKVYDEELIANWLCHKVAAYAKIPIEHIETDSNVSETYGLSSIDAISLFGELEEFIGSPVSPSILFDYSTIEELANHLALRDGKAHQFLYRLHVYLNSRELDTNLG